MAKNATTIAIVYSLGDELNKGEERDLISVQETAELAHCVAEALHTYHYKTLKIPVRNSLEQLRRDLALLPVKSTFIFNFCEDFGATSLESTRVAYLIENMGFPYTGRRAAMIENCVDKATTKSCLAAHGILTPAYQIFSSLDYPFLLNFPVIVKPVAEDASCGIDLESVVSDQDSLFARVAYILERYQQPALVEQFISGRELTVSILGNESLEFLPISEIDYSGIADPLERIRTYTSKWVTDSPDFNLDPYKCPADLPPDLAHKVYQAAGAAYQAIGMRDYGRVDLRLSGNHPYVLEINEAPDLAPNASFPASAVAAGYTYAQMVERIFKVALARERSSHAHPGRENRPSRRFPNPYYGQGVYSPGLLGD